MPTITFAVHAVLDMESVLIAVIGLLFLTDGVRGDTCLPPAAAENCRKNLHQGQFFCVAPPVDPVTQSLEGCGPDGWVNASCFAAFNVSCGGEEYNASQCIFQQRQPCRYVRGRRYNYYVAVALSLFLGMFGIDRFYLGYPAIGLAKLCTLGFLFIGQLVDFLLILLQVVGPADRSQYFVPFYGPILMDVNTADPFLPISNQTCA